MVRSRFVSFALCLLAYGTSEAAAQNPLTTGRLVGTVTGPDGEPLPGVSVALTDAAGAPRAAVTDAAGRFTFEGLADGELVLTAALGGYTDAERRLAVESGTETRVEIEMALAPISESVVIRDRAANGESNDPKQATEITPEQFDALPLPTDRFQEALPLVPGVVRDPEGRLSFNGSRPSQSQLLVNGANVTDPVTGEFAVELPLKAIEAVEVNSLPYSAEYGRVTGAVAKVKTRRGTDEFDLDFGDLWPRPNFRGGSIRGLRSFFPQIQVSGPIKKGKAWFSQGLAYRYRRSRVFDVEEGDDERVLESFDTLTQLDFRLSERHELTTTFSFFPVEVDNLGLSALVASDAAPEFGSKGWNAAFSERAFFSRALVETIVAVKKFDVKLTPTGTGSARLTPDGLRGDYFNVLERDSLRFEAGTAVTYAPKQLHGEHILKFGGNLSRTGFTGMDEGRPVDVVDGEGRLVQRIEFLGEPAIRGYDVQISAFVQDQWRLSERIGIDVGLRYDYDHLVGKHQLAPRLAGAFALDDDGRSVLKAGFGVFYDHVFLQADHFDETQSRRETRFAPDGSPLGEPLVLQPRTAAEGLTTPRSTTWNVELGRLVGKNLELRVNYRERRGSKEMIVDRLEQDGAGTLLLSSSGESLLRELDVTLRLQRNDNELYASFVRSRSTGDLNHIGTLYGNLREPLLFENQRSLYELDVPARALVWGVWKLPKDIIVAPGIEWRKGFPHSAFDPSYRPVGVRNGAGRFPNFLSIDVRVTKGLTVKGRKVRVGFQIFNFGSHFNPRDAVTNQGSLRFGEFLNSPDMGFSLRFSLGS